MSEAITTGVFGTLIVAILVYLVARVDRLADKIDQIDERLSARIDELGQRVARIEGRLDEREHTGHGS